MQQAEQVSGGGNVAVLARGEYRSAHICYYPHFPGGVRMFRSGVRVRGPATSSSLRVVGRVSERVGLIVGDVASTRWHRHLLGA
jgi:hypothetical protein